MAGHRTTPPKADKPVPASGPKRNVLGFPVVVLGASAGGIEALRALFQGLSETPNAALIVITHLPADKESHMAEVLSRFTSIPVRTVDNMTLLEPGILYTVPPGWDLAIRGGVLHLLPPNHRLDYRIIDRFLDSLVKDQGPNIICVLLSGSGTDGTLGAIHVDKAGGLVLVQDPATAIHSSMPLSALESGVTDAVLSAKALGESLPQYIAKITACMGRKEDTSTMRKVLEQVLQHIGQDMTGYRQSTIERRINKRRMLTGNTSLQSYLSEVERNPEERQMLFKSLLIGVTSFFRDAEAFELLREKVLPNIFFGHDTDGPVRIWAAGCSTGEEAYSIAILIDEYMAKSGQQRSVKIFATDIDAKAIEQARKGSYPQRVLQHLSLERLNNYFRCTQRECTVLPRLRESIVFVHHNLLQDPPFLHMDLVICRNLLIYFTPPLQEKALALLTNALNPSGYLFLGSAETLDAATLHVEAVEKKWRLFRSLTGRNRSGLRQALVMRHSPSLPDLPDSTFQARRKTPATLATEALLRHFNPPSVLISLEYNVLHIHGDTTPLLSLSTGEPSLQLLKLVRKDLRMHLREALQKVTQSQQPFSTGLLHMTTNPPQGVEICVDPVMNEAGQLSALLVIFKVSPLPEDTTTRREQEPLTGNALVQRYEDELQRTQEHLQNAVDDYEKLNEELRASNEELISMNEELQSSNEEMDASREELQSLNEELSVKVEELAKSHSFVENLLRSTNVPTVFLDNELKVLQATPTANEIFHLAAFDKGRSIGVIKARLRDDNLLPDAEQVLKDHTQRDREVLSEDGRSFIKRVFPYSNTHDQVDGVVMTYTDITSLKAAEEVLRLNNEELEKLVTIRTGELEQARRESELRATEMEAIMEQTPAAVWITRDTEAKTIIGNQTSYRLLRMLPGSNVSKAKEGVTYIPMAEGRELPLSDLPMQQAARGIPVVGRELDISFSDGEVRTLLGNATPLRNFLGEVSGAVGAFLDITDLKHAQLQAERWQQMFEKAEFGLAIASVADNTYLSVNPTFARQRGYTPEELVGKSLFDVYPPSTHHHIKEHISSLDDVGHGVFESQHRRKDGSIFPVLVEVTVLRNSAGKPEARMAYCLDITDLKWAREQASRWQYVFENAQFGLAVSRTSDNTLLTVNPSFARERGYTPEELVGFPVAELFPPERRAELLNTLISLEEAGHGVFESEHVRKDGSTFPVLLELTILKDSEGQTLSRVAYALNITDQKRAEAVLHESEKRFRTLFSSMIEGLCVLEMIYDEAGEPVDYIIQDVNPAYERILGVGREEAIGRKVTEIFGFATAPDMDRYATLVRTGVSVTFDTYLPELNQHFRVSAFSVQKDIFAVVFQDISAHKRAEDARRLAMEETERSRAQFAAVFNAVSDGIVVTDMTGAFIMVNDAHARNNAFANAEEMKRELGFYADKFRLAELDGTELPFEQWPIKRVMRGESVVNYDLRLTRTDLPFDRIVSYSGHPMYNEHGVQDLCVIVARDITDKMRTDADLLTTSRRLRLALEAANAGTWEWDLLTNKCTWSSELFRLSDQDPETTDPSFATWLSSIHPDERATVQRTVETAATKGEQLALEYRVNMHAGEPRWLYLRGQPQPDDNGKILRYHGIVLDITIRKQAENAICASELRFRELFNLSPVPLCYLHENGTFLDINNRFIATFGYTLEDVPNIEHWWVHAYPDPEYRGWVQNTWQAASEQAKANGSDIAALEYQVCCKDGRTRTVVISGISVGQGSLVTFFDITERRQAENALRQSELKLRTVADYTYDWEYWRDTKGKLVWVSPSCKRLTGYTAQEFLDDTSLVQRIVHPEDRDAYDHHLERTQPDDASASNLDYRIHHRDGHVVWISHHCININSAEGMPLGRRVSNRDITDRKGYEIALAERKEQLRLFVAHAPASIAMFDVQMRYLAVSQRWKQDYHLGNVELIGCSHYDIFPEISENWREVHRRCLGGAVERMDEDEFIRADGTIQWICWEIRPWHKDTGEVGGIVCFTEDITARKQVNMAIRAAKEAAEAANMAKSEFLANMSHEIRTPLNGVLGMLQLLRDGATPAEQKLYSTKAHDAARRLLSLLNDILDFSRMEAGRITLAHEPFQLSSLFESVSNVFSMACAQKNIILRCKADAAMPRQFLGDEARLRQLLFNLVGNAVKFTPVGSVNVTAWSQPFQGAADKVHLYFCVSDTGIGIPPEKVELVFQRFTQTDASYTRKYEGAGLGLAIVKRLMQVMNGDILVDSTEGEGTAIYLHLPMRISRAALTPRPHADHAHTHSHKKLNILVVEDESIGQLAIKTMLERLGHVVTCAENGRKAVEAVAAQAFDCVLMDIQMPVLNGMEATEEIRNMTGTPDRTQVWIIALTAYALAGDRERFLAAGLDDYLSKPVQEEQLTKVLGRIGRHKASA